MGEAAALLSALCWATTSVALARLGATYSGAMLSGLRFLIASPFVIALLVVTGGVAGILSGSWAPILIVVLSAGVNYGIGDTLYVGALPRIGLQRMAPTTTALWVAFSTLGGVLILGEPASVNLVLGAALVIAGTYLVVAARIEDLPNASRPQRPSPLATLLVMLAVAGSWSASTLLIAGGRGDLDAIAVSAIRIPAGGVLIAAVLLVTTRGEVLHRLPQPRDLPLVIAVGILGTALGGLAYIYAVAEAGAARAVILNSTSPLMVVPLAIAFLGERPTRRVALGTVCCLAGTLSVVVAG